MSSNCFENALVLRLNCFLSQFGILLHLFDLGLEVSFGCGKIGLNSPFVSQEIIY